MLIHLPDINEPFCVTDTHCYDHKHHIYSKDFSRLSNGVFRTFILISQEQSFVIYKSLGERNLSYLEWYAENFQGLVATATVTIATGNGRYENGSVYGFENPDDAIMFKLKWI